MTCDSCLEKDKIISELVKRLEGQNKRIEKLEERIQELSSWIWKPQKSNTPKKQGAKQNHEPHNRPPPDEIHEKKELSLSNCPDCGNSLPEKPVRTRKRYVEDIRPPEPINTEYTVPHYWCTHCNKQVSPKPAGPVGPVGP